MRKSLPWLLIFIFALLSASRATVLTNNYIKIIVNDGPWDTGRFTLETTGGDPAREEDNFQQLLFGGADPWSSYTTIRIDGKDYLFGGPTQRRAGYELPTGEHVSGPQVRGSAIYTTYRIGQLEVTQVLSIVRSTTTGLEDTMQIQYRIINQGSGTHTVGVRVLLDTKLGTEDGAPIRLGDRVITTETALWGGQIPEFWQAFDNLDNPQVIAQGTLHGGDLSSPDCVLIANWGTLADKSWLVSVNPNQGFIREGEDEPDTAFALYWEGTIGSGGGQTYTTHYGLGGVTISKGRLSLGVTSPREVIRRQSFKIIAYIENKERSPVENAWVRLDLPGGFTTVSPKERQLGRIEGQRALTVEWNVVAGETAKSGASYKVTVGGDNCEPVSATRRVEIVGPPRITLKCDPPLLENYNEQWLLSEDPAKKPIWIFPLKVKVANEGDRAASVEIYCQELEYLKLAIPYDRYKYIGTLEPGQSYDFIWYFAPVGFGGAIGKYKLVAKYMGQEDLHLGYLEYPKLNPKLSLLPRKSKLENGQILGLDLWIQNAPAFLEYSAVVMYDPEQFAPVSTQQGTAIRGGEFRFEEDREGIIRIWGNLQQRRDVRLDTLATLYFEALASGTGEIKVIPVSPGYPQVGCTIKIEEATR
jgi:hypothetical protein